MKKLTIVMVGAGAVAVFSTLGTMSLLTKNPEGFFLSKAGNKEARTETPQAKKAA